MEVDVLPTIKALDLEEERRACERSLFEFCKKAWLVVEPGTLFKEAEHIEIMCMHLEAVTAGKIHRLVINVPPGYAKSRVVTTFWPCWEWIQKPALRYMCASYSAGLSVEHNVERRDIIRSDWYQGHWGHPHVIVDQDGKPQKIQGIGAGIIEDIDDEGNVLAVAVSDHDSQKTQFTNTAKGKMMTTSVGGTSTGKGGERIIIDDPLNPTQAESDADREAAKNWFKKTIQTRLRDKRHGAIVIVMQRLHHSDTSQLALEQGYDHLCLPVEYEVDTVDSTVFPDCDKRTVEGELLWPEHEGPEEIAEMKFALGTYGFAGQYQQRPSPEGGGKFRKEWFNYYEKQDTFYILRRPGVDQPERYERDHFKFVFQTADLALSEKEQADFTVICTWGVTPKSDIILMDLLRVKREAPEVETLLLSNYHRWKPDIIAVEKAHYGMAICQRFNRMGLPLRELIADKDKITRSMTASVRMENGAYWFPQQAEWLDKFEFELLGFPNMDHDDQVDNVSYAALLVLEEMGNVCMPDRIASPGIGGMSMSEGYSSVTGGTDPLLRNNGDRWGLGL